jgi:exocyst complex component 1
MTLDHLVASDFRNMSGADGEDETAQATLASVEEMLEGYEWATDDILGRKGSTGTADQIEARLLDELSALEKVYNHLLCLVSLQCSDFYYSQANVHSFIESDDRIDLVIKYLDESIAELDAMESYVSSYKIHLNVSTSMHNIAMRDSEREYQEVADDISYIESQNRGLQVQTQNQRALVNELEQLLVSHIGQY